MMSPKNEEAKQKLLRKIPSVDRVLEHDDMAALLKEYPRGLVVKAIQKRLEKTVVHQEKNGLVKNVN